MNYASGARAVLGERCLQLAHRDQLSRADRAAGPEGGIVAGKAWRRRHRDEVQGYRVLRNHQEVSRPYPWYNLCDRFAEIQSDFFDLMAGGARMDRRAAARSAQEQQDPTARNRT